MVCVQCTHVEIPTSALPHHMCVQGSAPQQPQPPSGLVTLFPRHHLRPCTQQACASPAFLPHTQLTGLPCPCGLFPPALPRQAPCPPPLYWHKNEDPLSRNTHWSQLAHILEDCQQKPSHHGRLRTPAHALPCQGASAHGRLCAHQSATAPLGARGAFPWPSNYGATLGQATQRLSPPSRVPQSHLLLEGRKTRFPSLLLLGYFCLAPGYLLRVSSYLCSYSLS